MKTKLNTLITKFDAMPDAKRVLCSVLFSGCLFLPLFWEFLKFNHWLNTTVAIKIEQYDNRIERD